MDSPGLPTVLIYTLHGWGGGVFQVFSSWESPLQSPKAYLIRMSFLLSIRMSFLVKGKKNCSIAFAKSGLSAIVIS